MELGGRGWKRRKGISVCGEGLEEARALLPRGRLHGRLLFPCMHFTRTDKTQAVRGVFPGNIKKK